MGRGGSGSQVVTDSMRLWVAAAGLLLSLGCSQDSGTMRGIVVEVEGDLENVSGFSVLVDGDVIEFSPSPAGTYAFPLTHLREHLRTGEPVQVGWSRTEDGLVVTFLDDA